MCLCVSEREGGREREYPHIFVVYVCAIIIVPVCACVELLKKSAPWRVDSGDTSGRK